MVAINKCWISLIITIMSLNKGKHIVEEINGVRCTIVESGITPERAKFLSDLLAYNGLTVMSCEDQKGDLILGVTDILFNSVIAVYQRRLKTKTGHKVTPAYWLETSFAETEAEVNYWNFNR